MPKSQIDLLAEINDLIKSNNTGAISGNVLNGVLKNMTDALYGSNFRFPADSALTTADIGKLLMNDGSGKAKVYQLAPATTEQLGQWVLQPLNFSEFKSNNIIKIVTEHFTVSATRKAWLGTSTTSSVADELNLIRTYLQANSQLANFSFNLAPDGNSLTIAETKYQSTIIVVSGFNDFPLRTVKDSLPALEAAPAYFPLGRLLGLDGTEAIISSNVIQEYNLEKAGSITTLDSLFSYGSDLAVTDSQIQGKLGAHIILPAANGAAAPVDINAFQSLDGSFINVFRYHFLGIAIGATNTTVTVFNLTYLSLILSVILKMAKAGLVNTGKTT